MLIDIIHTIHAAHQYAGIGPELGVGAVAEAYRFWKGRQQINEAKKFANTVRPISDVPIPGAITNNVRLATNSYGTSGLPGQSAIDNQLDASVQSGADSLIETGHGADTAAGIAALENSRMMAKAGVASDAAKLQLSKLATLLGTNSELGGYQAKKFETDWNWNERDPYLQKMAAASALKNAGEANTFNAISNISTLASGAMALRDPSGTTTNPVNKNNSPVDLTTGYNPNQYQFDTSGTQAGNEQDLMNNSLDAVNSGNDARIQQLKQMYPGYSDQQIQQMFLMTQQPQ